MLDYARGTPHRTFVLYPLAIVVGKVLLTGGHPGFAWPYLALFGWGYMQYRLCGDYRRGQGGGGPGMQALPDQLVTTGPYAITRNPMYLGHLIFMIGLAVTFWSLFAVALFVAQAIWFHRRVLADEARLRVQFGPQYTDYEGWVKRWIPGLL